jgi:hypothetical protein
VSAAPIADIFEDADHAAARRAYERSQRAQPHYSDGARRPNWDRLTPFMQESWRRFAAGAGRDRAIRSTRGE